MQRALGGPVNATVIFAVTLAIIFAAWYASEKTLSIHSIYTRRREAFYWAVVMSTFALGTALSDMTADTWGLDTGHLRNYSIYGTLPEILANWGPIDQA
jgi:uncharacterized membrane-anchored protein